MATDQYRDFTRPEFSFESHGVRDWLRWLRDEDVLHDFVPRPAEACGRCGGSKNPGYTTCWDCSHGFAGQLDELVAVTYSFDNGLESLLHRYKDWGPEYRWARFPLGSLIYAALRKHEDCFRAALGSNPVYTWVPSNNQQRDFDHLETALQGVQGLDGDYPWRKDIIWRSPDEQRPARRECKPDAYTVDPNLVRGRAVLLLDDVWTSGSSLVSAAAALKQAGADRVVGLVIGRQLNRAYSSGTNQQLCEEVEDRGWSFSDCALCA